MDADGGGGGQQDSFTHLGEKLLAADVRALRWCPTMDLLAIVTGDGQLATHRLNWQRLWAISPESRIQSLCWRPDGKELAAGLTVILIAAQVSCPWPALPTSTDQDTKSCLQDGCIHIYDSEGGELRCKTQAATCPITCMSWNEEPITPDRYLKHWSFPRGFLQDTSCHQA